MRVQLECEMKCVVVGELSVKHGLEWNWWDTTEITKMSDLLFLWEYSCVIAQRASLQILMCAEGRVPQQNKACGNILGLSDIASAGNL